MAYVQEPCDECGLIVPRNELTQISRRVVTGGTTGSVRTYARGGMGFTGGRTTYRIDQLRLCPACLAQWVEARRAQRRAAVAGVTVTALLILGIIIGLALWPRQATPTADVAPATGDGAAPASSNTSTDVQPDPEHAVAPTQATPPDARSGQPAVSEESPTPESVPASSSPDPETTAPPTPENTPALSKAVSQALDSGQVTPWSAGASRGEVRVGAERFYEGRPCRSFSYTIDGVPSPITYACDGLDGVWRPSHAFGPSTSP